MVRDRSFPRGVGRLPGRWGVVFAAAVLMPAAALGEGGLSAVAVTEWLDASREPSDAALETARRTVLRGASITAFEEHRHFVYAGGSISAATGEGDATAEAGAWVRRVLVVRPETVVVDDHYIAADAPGSVAWHFRSKTRPEPIDGGLRAGEGDGALRIVTHWPEDVRREAPVECAEDDEGNRWVTRVLADPPDGAPTVRFVHVIHRTSQRAPTPPDVDVAARDGDLLLDVRLPERSYRLVLPDDAARAGRIAVADGQGDVLLADRLLPAGVLPHGPEGIRLIERWDTTYRGGRPASWDTGRVSSDLREGVEEGTLPVGRIIELGCGSGTNAVYLASRGFEVTAVDLAPTALAQAEEKAREAGVEVEWLLADVLDLPEIEPFDAVYDRGCYHGVRQQAAAEYVESLRRLSRAGTLVLILAGNANEPPPRSGPPRVSEEEIRSDFAADFDILWLRETRFDTAAADRGGAWAWSILLRRKE